MSKVKKIVVVLFCLILAIIPCFSVSAETNSAVNGDIFPTWCAQPPASENYGYAEVLFQNATTGDKVVRVFIVSWSSSNSGLYDYVHPLRIYFENNKVTFQFSRSGYDKDVALDISHFFNNYRKIYTQNLGMNDTDDVLMKEWSWGYSGWNIIGWHVYGDIFTSYVGGITSEYSNFTVLYSGDAVAYQLLAQILANQKGSSQEIIDNQNENTDKITENDDKNTQSIIDNQNQLQENEKNEASGTGGGGVDDIGSVVPNDSQGFIDSIGNLVGAMSYTGTNCNWELPSVSLPKIDGVMPQIKLWDKKEIPFEYWIGQIPDGIMTLVRSLLTIALIVYCFKELYSIISYVLTLKGGGASE